MTLGQMDKLILEALEGECDVVEASQLIYSLKLKNQMLETLAIDAIADLVKAGLVAASGGTKIKITPLGKKNLEKDGRLGWEERSKITQ
jgi:predicted transcriptional regulator